jgi:hypothetical protein
MGAFGAALDCLSLLDELYRSKLAARPRGSPNGDEALDPGGPHDGR